MINTMILDRSPSVKWHDVAGLEKAKQALLEMVILPTRRKDLFTGLQRPSRGLLLFGPPGNGEDHACQTSCLRIRGNIFQCFSFYPHIKMGEGEKLVRTLFMVAISRQPSVIFID